MNIDLEDSLAELARSVGDGATARMTGQVHRMVSQVRRRRATRYAAQGAVGIGAAAAVAFGGIQLAGRTGTPDPAATTDPFDVDDVDTVRSLCGEPAPTTPAVTAEASATWHLTGELSSPVPAGAAVEVSTTLVDGESRLVTQGEATTVSLTLMVVADGVVVAQTTTAYPDDPAERPGSDPQDYVISRDVHDFIACGSGSAGDALPAGEYTLVAEQALLLADGTTPVEVTGGPWPFTITEADPDAVAEAEAAAAQRAVEAMLAQDQLRAQQAVDAILAEAATWGVESPGCGWAVEADPASPLALTIVSDATTSVGGAFLQLEADLTTIDGAHVIGNAGSRVARLVLARNGVVVGATYWDPADSTPVDVGPDSPMTLPLVGHLDVCSRHLTQPTDNTAGPALPPGTYQAHAVLDVMLKEVTTADGEATSRSDLVRAVSEPFDVTVTAPTAP
ncbi:hypothetical protein [Cellulomonas sp. KRMCY2]|uniref:hypothetical protein n=1 Tax=Cellulomonas sp. KRMCY2 TaxID=1304865 RepID=UPI00045EA23D|nr:hypothetical protein [Cellulomonas sp. KRMCY2]